MITTLAALALAPYSFSAPDDKLNLVRTFAAGETQAYALRAEMEGMSMVIDAEIVFKVKKASEGDAEVAMSVRKFAMSREGNDAGQDGPNEIVAPFDKYGMPHVMQTEGEAWVYILTAMSGFVPAKEIETGKSFPVSWESKDKAFKATGNGKLAEIVEHDGEKAARIEYDVEVKPGDDNAGHVKYKLLIGIDGSKPISAEGTVGVQDQTIKFSVKRLKA
jgi:hypothetical protein